MIYSQVLYFLELGTTGFGGPIALVSRMERDLVERRAWFTPEEFSRGLALAQIAPGPLAAQLAMYLGWLRGGIAGATIAGAAFVLPSFVIVLGIAWAYTRYGALPWMQAAFYGVGAAVIAVLARSAARLFGRTVPRDRLLWVIALINGIVVAFTERELVWVFLVSGLVPVMVRAVPWPRTAACVAMGPGLGAVMAPLVELFLFFAKAGAVVFGSGLAIIPFLHGEVVAARGWLTEQQFLDAVAVAMLTPGPVVITVAFIGWLVAGFSGATAAALGVFAPVLLVVILVSPVYERVMAKRWVRLAAQGVTAAAAGALAGAVVVLGRRALVDLTTVGIAALTLLVLLRWRRVPEPALLGAAAIMGLWLAG